MILLCFDNLRGEFKMKKIISIILAGCLVFALAGCSSNSNSQSEDTNKKLGKYTQGMPGLF